MMYPFIKIYDSKSKVFCKLPSFVKKAIDIIIFCHL